jgi:hypothetical protein
MISGAGSPAMRVDLLESAMTKCETSDNQKILLGFGPRSVRKWSGAEAEWRQRTVGLGAQTDVTQGRTWEHSVD